MADLNVTFKKPVEFTVNGEKYAIKPLSAGDGFKLSYLMEQVVKEQEKGGDAETLSADAIKAYDAVADAFAANAVRPDETRAILEALKDNDGMTWARLLMALAKKLMA